MWTGIGLFWVFGMPRKGRPPRNRTFGLLGSILTMAGGILLIWAVARR